MAFIKRYKKKMIIKGGRGPRTIPCSLAYLQSIALMRRKERLIADDLKALVINNGLGFAKKLDGEIYSFEDLADSERGYLGRFCDYLFGTYARFQCPVNRKYYDNAIANIKMEIKKAKKAKKKGELNSSELGGVYYVIGREIVGVFNKIERDILDLF